MRFFPGMEFGWCFYTLLLTGLAMLVYSDLRRQRLPNLMTMPLLLAGLLMNLVRAGWLGAMGEPGRYFGWTGVASGLLEGFCFSLAGFFIAFILFTSLWQFQTCGAGDVKLMAALGAWVGPLWFFFVFLGSMLAVVALMMIWWITAFTIRRNPGLKLSYALPAMISSALVLLWVWRKELLQH